MTTHRTTAELLYQDRHPFARLLVDGREVEYESLTDEGGPMVVVVLDDGSEVEYAVSARRYGTS